MQSRIKGASGCLIAVVRGPNRHKYPHEGGKIWLYIVPSWQHWGARQYTLERGAAAVNRVHDVIRRCFVESQAQVYSGAELAAVVDFAKDRGVRVMVCSETNQTHALHFCRG